MALKNPVFVWHLERRTEQAIYFSFHSLFPPKPHVLYLIADAQSPSAGFLSMAQDLLWLPLALICTTMGKPAHKHPSSWLLRLLSVWAHRRTLTDMDRKSQAPDDPSAKNEINRDDVLCRNCVKSCRKYHPWGVSSFDRFQRERFFLFLFFF